MSNLLNSLLANTNPYTNNNSTAMLGANSVTSNSSSTQTNRYYVAETMFTFNVRGLRANTQHYFYFGNTDLSSNCALIINSPNGNSSPAPLNSNNIPVGLSSLGTSLVTDQYGSIKFAFFFNSGLLANTDFSSSQTLGNLITGPVTCTLKTLDGSSVATMTINIKTGISNNSINVPLPVIKDATGDVLITAPTTFNQ